MAPLPSYFTPGDLPTASQPSCQRLSRLKSSSGAGSRRTLGWVTDEDLTREPLRTLGQEMRAGRGLPVPLPPFNESIGLATVRNDHAILLDPLLGGLPDGRGVTVIYTMLGRLDHYASQSIDSRITWVARFIYRHYFRIHFDQFVAKGSPP